jgi:hypothetical protein
MSVLWAAWLAWAAAAEPLASGGGEQELKAAVDLYRRGDFEQALAALDRVAASAKEPGLKARAHLARGQCFAALQRFDRIDAAFTQALEADPEISLDPSRVQPAIVSMLDAARERLKGELEVKGAEVEVLLDERPMGSAPLKASAGIGRRRLELRRSAGAVERRDVVVRAHQLTTVDLAPPPQVAAAPAAPPAGTEGLAGLIELRATVDPRDYIGPLRQAPVAPAPELSAGIGGEHWGVTAGGMLGGAWGVVLRATGRLPGLAGPLGVEGCAQGVLLFASPAVGGLAALVGPTLALGPWAEAFLGIGGGFVAGSPEYRGDYLLVSLALRARIRRE